MTGHRRAAGSKLRAARQAESKTEAFAETRPFKWLVRTGFVGRGVTYGIIGGLALAMALGGGKMGAPDNQQGALALVARGWLGDFALIVVAAGLLAYAVWKLIQGLLGRGPEGGGGPGVKDRLANVGGGIAYLIFFAVALRTLTGGNSSGGPRHAAAGVLGWPGGPELVGLAGGALLTISGYQIYEGVRGDFADDAKTGRISREERGLFMLLGRIGICARALVFVLVGYFLIRTAIEFNPSTAVGLDGALARVRHETLGSVLLAIVAVGLLVFAAFSFFEARLRRL